MRNVIKTPFLSTLDPSTLEKSEIGPFKTLNWSAGFLGKMLRNASSVHIGS